MLDNLARGLEAAGHEVLMFATGDSTCAVPVRWTLERAAGTVGSDPTTELRHVVAAYEAARDWGADVVHDHTLVGPLYSQRLPMPVVTTNHGPFSGVLGNYYRTIGGHVPIIAISHDQASRAVDTAVAAVIHHGIDVESFPLGRGDRGYALFLGRMNPDKGAHVAARIARRAGVALKIAAKMREPAERHYFEAEVEPLLGGDVEMLGEVGGEHKLELLAGASCLLNPIAWPEPFGMVMIEALACGTPVVATPRGSVPEIVDDGVTGFVRSDEGELAEAVERCADLDRARCRKEASLRFSTERMVRDHLRAYEEVAASRPLRAA